MNSVAAIAGVVIKELCRRKDFYVLFVLTAVITIVLGAQSFFDDNRIARYLKEICLLLIWISTLVIAIATGARQIPAERENRTIFPLLAKPVSRWQVILGKFLGCWLAMGLALFVFFLFFGLVAVTREHQWKLVNYFQAVWLQWIMLGIVIALTLLGSLIFTAPSSNATIVFIAAFGILTLGRHLNTVALQLSEPARSLLYTIYFIIPHLEFFDLRDLIVHNWEPIGWNVWLLATLYGTAYTAFFLLAAWLIFRRKPLN
jgi:ABC-type transport system involved in multi-copper enzyme maturation permease subunit